jgi:hypothetical protein
MLTNARRLCVARRGSAAASAGSLATCLAIPSPRTYPRPVPAHLLGGARRGAPPPPLATGGGIVVAGLLGAS